METVDLRPKIEIFMRRLQNFRLIQKPILLGLAALIFQNITAQEVSRKDFMQNTRLKPLN